MSVTPEIETSGFPEAKEEPTSINRVGRAVLVAPISLAELDAQFEAGVNPESIVFSSVLLVQKENRGVSASMLTTLGGEIHKDETSAQGTMREIAEESWFLGQNSRQQIEIWEFQNQFIPDFTYSIPGAKPGTEKRLAYIRVLPVLSSDVSQHDVRRNTKDKLQKLWKFTPSEYAQLVENGQITKNEEELRLIDHMVKSSTRIFQKLEDMAARNIALDRVSEALEKYELILRFESLKWANEIRKYNDKEVVNSFTDLEVNEIRYGFIVAQMSLELQQAHERDKWNKAHPENLKTQPPKHTDLLVMAKYLALLPPPVAIQALELLKTEAITPLMNAYRGAFTVAVDNLLISTVEFFKTKEVTFSDDAEYETYSLIINSLEKLTKDRIPDEHVTPYQKLVELWPIIIKLPTYKVTELFNKSNELFTQIFCSKMGITYGVLNDAVEIASNVPQYVSDKLSILSDSHQLHKESNKVSRADLFRLFLMAYGFTPNETLEAYAANSDRLIRYEANRKLALIGCALTAKEMIDNADNRFLEDLLDSLVTHPLKDHLRLPKDKRFPIERLSTKQAVGSDLLEIIVDKRPKKTPESLTRKLLQEGEFKIFDIFNINFILSNKNFAVGTKIEERLAKAFEYRQALLAHIDEELADSGWQVAYSELSDYPESYKNLLAFTKQVSGEVRRIFLQSLAIGKRAGSKGNLIIRDKFNIILTDPYGKTHSCEICIYPFESVKSLESSRKFRNIFFMGFMEKIIDDKSGRYNALRLIERYLKWPLESTLHDLMFPYPLYPEIHEHHAGFVIKSREKEILPTYDVEDF